MERLSPRKQATVVRLFLRGLPYDEVAAQAGVSKGAVANLVAELRAGRLAEAADVSGQVDVLRELAVDLDRAKLAPGQALTGVAVLSWLQELGVEPSDVERWVALCRRLAPQGTDVDLFVKAAMAFEEVRRRTGLDSEALEEQVRGFQEKAGQLAAKVRALGEEHERLREVQARRQALSSEVAELEKRRQPLSQSVLERERREEELTRRVEELEERAQAADERLAASRRDQQTLATLGVTQEALSGLVQRISGVAHRHRLAPADLQSRLLRELETLDAGLSLEALAAQKGRELKKEEDALAGAESRRKALEAENRHLVQRQGELKAAVAADTGEVRTALKRINAAAKEAVVELQRDLKAGVENAVNEVDHLKAKALEVGAEVGQLQATVEANQWLKTLLPLIRRDGQIAPDALRVAGVVMLQSLCERLESMPPTTPTTHLLTTMKAAAGELERWQV